MNTTACSQTGCSGLAPAPKLSLRGSGCRNLALPGVYEQALPFSSSYLVSFLLNLTHTTLPSAVTSSGGPGAASLVADAHINLNLFLGTDANNMRGEP